MSFYTVSAALTALTSFLLGVFVFTKNTKSIINKTWFLLSGSIAFWSLFLAFMFASKDAESGLFFSRMLQIGAIVIPAACLHFIVSLLRKNKKERFAIIISYVFCSLLLTANATPYFVKEASYVSIADCCYPRAGHLYVFYILYFFIASGYGTYLLIKEYNAEAGFRKNQLGYCVIASFIGFVGGSTTFPLWYNIQFPPLGVNLVWLYVVIITIAIVRYQLLYIEVIIKKTLVFAGLFGFVFAVIVAAALLTQEFVARYTPHSKYLALAVSAAIIVLLQQPVYNFLVNITNKYLFQKKYDARKMLKDFSNEALTILNLDTLCKVTIEALVRHLYLSNCAILLLSREEIGYQIYDSSGIEDKGVYFDSNNSLVSSLKTGYLPLLYQGYDKDMQASESAKKDMERIKSRLCLPLVIHNEMVGILSLGAKKSDQPYDENDIDILTTLIKTLSIAISNARLFMQAAQYEKLAAIGTLASAVNHEVCNPLNRIGVQIQAYILNKKTKTFANKALEEQFNEVEKIMRDIMTEIQKVANITGKLSSFAKPSKIVASKPIDIRQSIKDALDVLAHKFQLDRINIEENIPANLSKITADEDQMQEIFFNLLKNAAEAIKEKGTISITAKEDTGKVKIEVKDSGCGIPEDKLDKIFEPFVTTKTDGSGYGLAVVREIILRNKGSIAVKNNVDGGSTFYLEFPKA